MGSDGSILVTGGAGFIGSHVVEALLANISKAQRLLGYAPKVSVKDGMTKFFEWYKEQHHYG